MQSTEVGVNTYVKIQWEVMNVLVIMDTPCMRTIMIVKKVNDLMSAIRPIKYVYLFESILSQLNNAYVLCYQSHMIVLWNESLNSDGLQLHQYKKKYEVYMMSTFTNVDSISNSNCLKGCFHRISLISFRFGNNVQYTLVVWSTYKTKNIMKNNYIIECVKTWIFLL